MSSSILSTTESAISQPAPIPITNNYPPALPISPSITDDANLLPLSLEFTIRENIPADNFNHTAQISYTVLQSKSSSSQNNNEDIVYYYQGPPSYAALNRQEESNDQDSHINLCLLYDQQKQPLWKLVRRDRHNMSLLYQQQSYSLSITPPQFRFTFLNQAYHWQLQLTTGLKCYQTNTNTLIADFQNDRLSLVQYTTSNNPFRQQQNFNGSRRDDPFTTLIILTGLLVNQHIKVILKSLGDGPDVVDPSKRSDNMIVYEPHGDEYMTSGDIASIISVTNRNYPGHQSLVDDFQEQSSRWSSSAPSFKSIELDSGVCHCWWGYTCWWSWFPFCMPGGYCDRICFRRRKNNRPTKVTRSTRTLSKQGWQQQHY
ncbi:MAG: hypothetical protein EXX96DRAFT_546087 [Benjaminiella poitrasii]|nr:MAG: hypothetical protein EXX96DRAFT_546087 [Benjaminiella poitrasii]